ncbi:MAG TPA: FAD-dependent oxidoreductase [Nitrospinota bacterium]|nr:FAD-dependent oxidoreductase [Nitrospinota bacterium]|tara:strand:+ start:66671 stop:67948 length:1278 start_codon:yes stop_codon:yes gene_type:complete
MRYAIIGNSYAAVGAVEGIRSVDGSGEIDIYSDEPYQAYARPLISYFLEGRVVEDQMFYRTNEFYSKYNSHCWYCRVDRVDVEKQTIYFEDGESHQFDKLLICSGSKPFIPPIKGIHSNNVMGFKKWDDAKKLQYLATVNNKVIVLGGGLIGVKAAESLRNLGLNVSIISKGPRVLHLILDELAGEMVKKSLSSGGVDILTGFNPIEVLSDDDSDVKAIKLENGDILPCEILIVGKGVRPNIEFLGKESLEINNGIAVDRHMKTSADNVYAAGDVAEAWDLLSNENRVISIAPLAFEQGKVAGANMAGRAQIYQGGVPMNSIEIFGLSVMSIGLASQQTDGCEEVVCQNGDVYRKFVFSDNRLVGAILVGEIDNAGILTTLIRSQNDITKIKEKLCNVIIKNGDFVSIIPNVVGWGNEARKREFA